MDKKSLIRCNACHLIYSDSTHDIAFEKEFFKYWFNNLLPPANGCIFIEVAHESESTGKVSTHVIFYLKDRWKTSVKKFKYTHHGVIYEPVIHIIDLHSQTVTDPLQNKLWAGLINFGRLDPNCRYLMEWPYETIQRIVNKQFVQEVVPVTTTTTESTLKIKQSDIVNTAPVETLNVTEVLPMSDSLVVVTPINPIESEISPMRNPLVVITPIESSLIPEPKTPKETPPKKPKFSISKIILKVKPKLEEPPKVEEPPKEPDPPKQVEPEYVFTCDEAAKTVLIIEGVRQNWKPEPVKVESCDFHFLKSLKLQNVVLANAFEIRNILYFWKKGRLEKWE